MRDGTAVRGHELLPHTADARLRAWAPDLAGVFEEAALALAELSADVGAPAGTGERIPIEVEAVDLPGLAFAWLNELIGLADVHGAIAGVRVEAVERTSGDGWRLRGEARFVPFDGAARPRIDVKSATYHGLTVEEAETGWRLMAIVDL
ncbi:MAG TPA: archease [Candidatus Limnocylindrales bacterium]|nr:archease [Candidatus Limnocylindrales bacterium]